MSSIEFWWSFQTLYSIDYDLLNILDLPEKYEIDSISLENDRDVRIELESQSKHLEISENNQKNFKILYSRFKKS